jgi:hypothetical protein
MLDESLPRLVEQVKLDVEHTKPFLQSVPDLVFRVQDRDGVWQFIFSSAFTTRWPDVLKVTGGYPSRIRASSVSVTALCINDAAERWLASLGRRL